MAKTQERPNPLDPAGAHLMAAWRRLGLTARQAYNCVEATRQMAGHNNTAQIESLRSEFTTKLKRTEDQLSAKIDQQGRELRSEIADLEQRLTVKLTDQEERFTAKLDELEGRLTAKLDEREERLTAKLDVRVDRLTAKFDDQWALLGGKMERLIGGFQAQEKFIWTLIGILTTGVIGILATLWLRPQVVPAHTSPPIAIEATQPPVTDVPQPAESEAHGPAAGEP